MGTDFFERVFTAAYGTATMVIAIGFFFHVWYQMVMNDFLSGALFGWVVAALITVPVAIGWPLIAIWLIIVWSTNALMGV